MTGSAGPMVGRVSRSLQGYACGALGPIYQSINATGLATASFGVDATAGHDCSDSWRREQLLQYRDHRSVLRDNWLLILCSNPNLARGPHPTEKVRGFASFTQISERQNTKKAAVKDGVPLLRRPPNPHRVPRITLESCPDLKALAAHIETFGSQYELRDVQAGLQVLAQLAPLARLPSATAGAPAQSTNTNSNNYKHNSNNNTNVAVPSTSSIAALTSPSAEAQFSNSPPGPALDSPSPSPSTQPTPSSHPPSARQCARWLAHLGHYHMRKEVAKHDIGTIAGCISALAGTSQEAYSEDFVLPFLLWLRDPRSIFMMHTLNPVALISVLHALAGLRPRLDWTPANRQPFGTVVRRVLMGLMEQASELSTQDIIAAVDGIARLNLDVRGRDVTLRALQVLANHTRVKLLPENHVRPDEAVQLLYLYGYVLPGAATVAPESSSARSGKAQTDLNDATTPVPKHAVTNAHVAEVAALVPKLSDLACRALKSFQPHELARFARALAALGAKAEAQSALPWLTPVLLKNLEKLDKRALVDVAYAYHVLHLKEPGLVAAIGQQIVASGEAVDDRDVRKLVPCFRAGSAVEDEALWSLLRQHLRDATERMPVHVLEKLRRSLNLKDSADAEVIAAIDVRLNLTSREPLEG